MIKVNKEHCVRQKFSAEKESVVKSRNLRVFFVKIDFGARHIPFHFCKVFEEGQNFIINKFFF